MESMCAMLSYKDTGAVLNSIGSELKDVIAKTKKESEQKIRRFFMTVSLPMLVNCTTCAKTASAKKR